MSNLKHICFSSLAFVLFDRSRALLFCSWYVFISLIIEINLHIPYLFSCSGAIVSIAGLFLNIKHSLHFHLKLPKKNIYHMLAGAGTFGKSQLTQDDEKWVDDILSDEMYGVTFMVIGTLIWAYGSYLT